MKTSTDRILTSHVGSLPRPPDLLKLIKAKVAAQPFDEKELGAEVRKAIDQCVRRQADIGLDVISDGEMSKPSFLTYIVERLGGVEVTNEPFGNPWKGSRENNAFPEYYAWEASLSLNPAVGAKRVICTGPVAYKGHAQVRSDIETFKAALANVKVAEAFLPAISPANVEFWIRNEHYKSDEEYIFALADALHEEYKAITDSGLILQIDDPRLVTQYVIDAGMSLADYRKWAQVRVDALNHALRGLPQDRNPLPHLLQHRHGAAYQRRRVEARHRYHSEDHCRRLFVRGIEPAARAQVEGLARGGPAQGQGADPRRHHPFDRARGASGAGVRPHPAFRGGCRPRTGHCRHRLRLRHFRGHDDDPSNRGLGQARGSGARRAVGERAAVGPGSSGRYRRPTMYWGFAPHHGQ